MPINPPQKIVRKNNASIECDSLSSIGYKYALGLLLFTGVPLSMYFSARGNAENQIPVKMLELPDSDEGIRLLAQSGSCLFAQESLPQRQRKAARRSFLFFPDAGWLDISQELISRKIDGTFAGLVSDGATAHMFWMHDDNRFAGLRHLAVGPDDTFQEFPMPVSMPDVTFELHDTACSENNIAAVISPHPLVYLGEEFSGELQRGAVFVWQADGWNLVRISSWNEHATALGMDKDLLWVVDQAASGDTPTDACVRTYSKIQKMRYVLSAVENLTGPPLYELKQLTAKGRYLIRAMHHQETTRILINDLKSNAATAIDFNAEVLVFAANQMHDGSMLILTAPSLYFPEMIEPFVVKLDKGDGSLRVVRCKAITAPKDLAFEKVFALIDDETLCYFPKYGSTQGF